MSGQGPRNDLADENGHPPSPPFWFSYNYGSVHFTTLSSEHDLTKGSKQIKVGPSSHICSANGCVWNIL